MSVDGQVAVVPLTRVVADPGLWPREQLHHGRVEEFMELYRDGGLTALPPLDVVADRESLLLGDGWHRHAALTRLGSATARVRWVTEAGDPTEVVYRHGLLTASSAALPLTRPERRAAVIRLLEDHPDLPDREIARLVGVSPTTVGTRRRLLAEVPPRASGPAECHVSAPVGPEPSPDLYTNNTVVLASADELAAKLARGLRKTWEARGLSDLLLGDRTGRRLATALRAEHGNQALAWARRLAQWADRAVKELEGPAS